MYVYNGFKEEFEEMKKAVESKKSLFTIDKNFKVKLEFIAKSGTETSEMTFRAAVKISYFYKDEIIFEPITHWDKYRFNEYLEFSKTERFVTGLMKKFKDEIDQIDIQKEQEQLKNMFLEVQPAKKKISKI